MLRKCKCSRDRTVNKQKAVRKYERCPKQKITQAMRSKINKTNKTVVKNIAQNGMTMCPQGINN